MSSSVVDCTACTTWRGRSRTGLMSRAHVRNLSAGSRAVFQHGRAEEQKVAGLLMLVPILVFLWQVSRDRCRHLSRTLDGIILARLTLFIDRRPLQPLHSRSRRGWTVSSVATDQDGTREAGKDLGVRSSIRTTAIATRTTSSPKRVETPQLTFIDRRLRQRTQSISLLHRHWWLIEQCCSERKVQGSSRSQALFPAMRHLVCRRCNASD